MRISNTNKAVEVYRERMANSDLPLFREVKACFYWDSAEVRDTGKRLNLICAEFPEFIEDFNPHSFIHSFGADGAGWANGGAQSAAGFFGQTLTFDQLNLNERIDLVLEFCRIAECDWARSIVAMLFRATGVVDDYGDALDATIKYQADVERVRNDWHTFHSISEEGNGH